VNFEVWLLGTCMPAYEKMLPEQRLVEINETERVRKDAKNLWPNLFRPDPYQRQRPSQVDWEVWSFC